MDNEIRMVPQAGLEPARLSAMVSKTIVATKFHHRGT